MTDPERADEGSHDFSRVEGVKYTKEELRELLREFGDELGHAPSSVDVKKNDDLPSATAYLHRFGDWESALSAAGFNIAAYHSPFDDISQIVSPDTVARTPAIIGTELTITRDGREQTVSSGRVLFNGRPVTIEGFELAVTDRGRDGWLVRLTYGSDEYLLWLDDFFDVYDDGGGHSE